MASIDSVTASSSQRLNTLRGDDILVREVLLEKTREILAKTGFYLSGSQNSRGLCFDIVARRDDVLLLVKVLTNVDSFSLENSQELKMIATTLAGSPLLLGVKSGAGELEEGVVYSRFGVPVLALQTFYDLVIEGMPPVIFAAPGGLYVRIDGEVLTRAREAKTISLGTLAEVAGVSRRTIQMYIEGMGATVEIALKLEEFLGEPLITAVNPLAFAKQTDYEAQPIEGFQRFAEEVYRRLNGLGYSIVPTVKSPFDAFAREKKNLILTGVEMEGQDLARKAETVVNISRIVERDSALFVESKRVKLNLHGVPIISQDDLKKAQEADDILELIAERKRR